MDKLLTLEEIAQLIATLIALYYQPLEFRRWTWIILFLLPDIGMLGYLINTSAGAVSYNFFHHKLVAVLVFGAGWYMNMPVLTLSGLLLYGHSSFDRVMGYGLKYMDSFRHTHLRAL